MNNEAITRETQIDRMETALCLWSTQDWREFRRAYGNSTMLPTREWAGLLVDAGVTRSAFRTVDPFEAGETLRKHLDV